MKQIPWPLLPSMHWFQSQSRFGAPQLDCFQWDCLRLRKSAAGNFLSPLRSKQQLSQFLRKPALGLVLFCVDGFLGGFLLFGVFLVDHFINVLCLNEWPRLALSVILPNIKRLLPNMNSFLRKHDLEAELAYKRTKSMLKMSNSFTFWKVATRQHLHIL